MDYWLRYSLNGDGLGFFVYISMRLESRIKAAFGLAISMAMISCAEPGPKIVTATPHNPDSIPEPSVTQSDAVTEIYPYLELPTKTPEPTVTPSPTTTPRPGFIPEGTAIRWSDAYIAHVPKDQKDIWFTVGNDTAVFSFEQPYVLKISQPVWRLIQNNVKPFTYPDTYRVHPIPLEKEVSFEKENADFEDINDDSNSDSTGHGQYIIRSLTNASMLNIFGHAYRDYSLPVGRPLSLDWLYQLERYWKENLPKNISGSIITLEQTRGDMTIIMTLKAVSAKTMTEIEVNEKLISLGDDPNDEVYTGQTYLNTKALGLGETDPDKQYITFYTCQVSATDGKYGNKTIAVFEVVDIVIEAPDLTVTP